MSEKPTATPKSTTRDPAEVRRRIHDLVNRLPESELWRGELLLRAVVEDDPFLWSLATAPYDDEPLTEESEAKIKEGIEAAERGELRPLEDVARELGL